MNKSIFTILTLFLASVLMSADNDWTKVENPEAVVASFNEVNSRVSAIDCRFTRQQRMDVLVDDVESSGKYHYSAPDNMSIEYDEPRKFSISISSGEITVSSGDKVTTKNLSSDRRSMELVRLFRSGGIPTEEVSSRYKILAYENASCYRLIISPVRIRQQTIEAVIDKKDMSLVSFTLTSDGGDWSRYSFSDKKIVYAAAAAAESKEE